MVMTAGKHCLQTIPPPSSLIFLTWKHPEYFPHSPRARSAQRWCALQDRVSLDIFCRLAGESKDKWVEILKEKKKVWSECSKCEKITAPCKCGLVKSLAAKTEGSWKQLSPLVSNVFNLASETCHFGLQWHCLGEHFVIGIQTAGCGSQNRWGIVLRLLPVVDTLKKERMLPLLRLYVFIIHG